MGLVKPPKECLVCLNSSETTFVPTEQSQKIFNICSSYVKDGINIEFLINNIIGNSSQLSFCKNCLDCSLNLSQLVEQLSKLKKEINDLSSRFSETIAQQRIQATTANTRKQKFNNRNAKFQATNIQNSHPNSSSDRHLLHELSNDANNDSFVSPESSQEYKPEQNCINEISIETVKTESDDLFLDYNDESCGDHMLGYNENEDEHETNNFASENEIDSSEEKDLVPTYGIANNCNVSFDESESDSQIGTSKSFSESVPSVLMPNILYKGIRSDVTSGSGITFNSTETSDQDKSGVKINKNPPSRYRNFSSTGKKIGVKELTNKMKMQNKYNCSVCQKSFWAAYDLKRHSMTHTGEKPFKCEVCGRSFRHSSDLQIHETIHTGQKPYKCSWCESSFVRKNDLKCHENTHTNERPFQCSQCSMSFARAISLKDHERTHTGETPYKCHYCEVTFKSRWARVRHQRKVHPDEQGN